MLTQEEVKRLEEVEELYDMVCEKQVVIRRSKAYQMQFERGLSPEEKQEMRNALEKEKELEKEKDLLVSERRSFYKKRGYMPSETPEGDSWYFH